MNENWDEDVRADMSDALDGIVKEDKGASDIRRARKQDTLQMVVMEQFASLV